VRVHRTLAHPKPRLTHVRWGEHFRNHRSQETVTKLEEARRGARRDGATFKRAIARLARIKRN
jgi:hypothetical protein